MEQRRFGRTGFDISAFTLGGGYVGGILIHQEDEIRLQALQRRLVGVVADVDLVALDAADRRFGHRREDPAALGVRAVVGHRSDLQRLEVGVGRIRVALPAGEALPHDVPEAARQAFRLDLQHAEREACRRAGDEGVEILDDTSERSSNDGLVESHQEQAGHDRDHDDQFVTKRQVVVH